MHLHEQIRLLFSVLEVIEIEISQFAIVHQLFKVDECWVELFHMEYDGCCYQVHALHIPNLYIQD